MRRFPRQALTMAFCLLAGFSLFFLAGGWFALNQTQQIRDELVEQSTISGQLSSLAARQDLGETLTATVAKAQERLAPAARATGAEAASESLPQQLETTLSALLDLGLRADEAEDRTLAWLTAQDLWWAAQTDGVELARPQLLSQAEAALASTSCASPAQASPLEPLAQLQASLDQLIYLSQVYTARAQQDYGQVAEQAQVSLSQAGELRELISPLLACQGQQLADQPAYQLAEPEQAAAQLEELQLGLSQQVQGLLRDPNLPLENHELENLALVLLFALPPVA